jgi:hypothetical protein
MTSLNPEFLQRIVKEMEFELQRNTPVDIFAASVNREHFKTEHPYDFEYGHEVGMLRARMFYEWFPKYHQGQPTNKQCEDMELIIESYADKIKRKLTLLADADKLQKDR